MLFVVVATGRLFGSGAVSQHEIALHIHRLQCEQYGGGAPSTQRGGRSISTTSEFRR